MRVRIHRGAQHIGGSCVEVEAQGHRIVLDLGRPLDAPPDVVVPLPSVDGIDGRPGTLLGILLSHPHRDHWGLIPDVAPSVPLYMGEAGHRILREAAFWGAGDFDVPLAGAFVDRNPFQLGPFRVTPFLADHSAFDAYSLLIEADGESVFYTGDFRGHGRKAGLFERLLLDPPRDVDVLLMEGTQIPSAGGAMRGSSPSEADVEVDFTASFCASPGPVLVAMSAQNIDRLVTVFRACRRAQRTLVVDLYSARVAIATGHRSIPQPGFDGYRVWVPHGQRVRVKVSGQFERVQLGSARIFPEEMARIARAGVFLFRPGLAGELDRAGCIADARLVWSLWPGYLEAPHDATIRPFLDRHRMEPQVLHTSGHATAADLLRLVAALRPRRLVPIHTFGRDRYAELFGGAATVDMHDDGLWWEVRS